MTPPMTATPGLYPLSAIGTNSADPSVTTSSSFTVKVVQRPTTIVYTGDLTADYHDPAQLSALLTDTLTGAPLAGETVSLLAGHASRRRNDAGKRCRVGHSGRHADTRAGAARRIVLRRRRIPPEHQLEDVHDHAGADHDHLHRADGHPAKRSGVTLEAKLLEDGTTPPFPSGQTLTLSLGSQSCTATVDAAGIARCTLTFTGALGSQPLAATFAGDALPAVLGHRREGDRLRLPGPRRLRPRRCDRRRGGRRQRRVVGCAVELTEHLLPRRRPGRVQGLRQHPAHLPKTSPAGDCTGTWTTAPGNSSKPVGEVPSYMGVLVAGTATKSGPVVSGSYARIVVVRTDPGYSATPATPEPGGSVATFCP